jgi:hypothetical protein
LRERYKALRLRAVFQILRLRKNSFIRRLIQSQPIGLLQRVFQRLGSNRSILYYFFQIVKEQNSQLVLQKPNLSRLAIPAMT